MQTEFSSPANLTQLHFHGSNNEFCIETKAKINDIWSYMFFAKCIFKVYIHIQLRTVYLPKTLRNNLLQHEFVYLGF